MRQPGSLALDTRLSALGTNSIDAIHLAALTCRGSTFRISIVDIIRGGSIRGIAKIIDSRKQGLRQPMSGRHNASVDRARVSQLLRIDVGTVQEAVSALPGQVFQLSTHISGGMRPNLYSFDGKHQRPSTQSDWIRPG